MRHSELSLEELQEIKNLELLAIERAKQAKEIVNKELLELETKKAESIKIIESLESDFNQKKESIKSLDSQVSNINQEIQELGTHKQAINQELVDLIETIELQKKTIKSNQNEISILEAKLNEFTALTQSTKDHLLDLSWDIKTKEDELDKLNLSILSSKEKLDDLQEKEKAQISSFELLKTGNEKIIELLESKIKGLKSNNESIEQTFNALTRQKEDLIDQVTNKQTQLNKIESEINERLEILKVAEQKLNHKIKQVEQTIREAKADKLISEGFNP